MALREFEEVLPGKNIPIIVGKSSPLCYIKNTPIEFHSAESLKRKLSAGECEAVIFHSLPDVKLLNLIPEEIKVVWIGWGYDYYQRLLVESFPDGLFLPKTRNLYEKLSAPPRFSKVKTLIKAMFKISEANTNLLLSRVDFFSPVIDVEYHLARNNNSWFRAKYLEWNYGTVEDDLSASEDSKQNHVLGGNILVGNNAYFENNHLEVFETLKSNVDLKGKDIFVPLSYGSSSYKEKLINIGKTMFGTQFVPLTDFVEKKEYIKLLQSCGYVFMNHIRQQALANICIMMLKGARIYMNSASPLYRWFLDRGAVIDSMETIENIEGNCPFALEPLSKVEQLNNIDIINKHWGREMQRVRTHNLVDLIFAAEPTGSTND